MFLWTEELNQDFNAYYNYDHILIQFILLEFASAVQEGDHLKNLVDHCLTPPHVIENFLPEVNKKISCLIGRASNYNLPWDLSPSQGSLNKLKRYSEQLSLNTGHQNKHYRDLQTLLLQSWICCMNCLGLLNGSLYPRTPFTTTVLQPIVISSLKHSISSLDDHLKNVSKVLIQILFQFVDNENVLYFLLRRQDLLLTIFERSILQEVFAKSHPNLVELLKQRYQHRGFSNLADRIDHQLLPANLERSPKL